MSLQLDFQFHCSNIIHSEVSGADMKLVG